MVAAMAPGWWGTAWAGLAVEWPGSMKDSGQEEQGKQDCRAGSAPCKGLGGSPELNLSRKHCGAGALQAWQQIQA
jgi:hypothetical protein